MRIWLSAVALMIVCFSAKSQDRPVIDSLNHILNSAIADTTRVNVLIDLASQYYLYDPSRAVKFCEQAKEISETIQYAGGLSNSYGWLAYLYEQQGEINKSIEYYELSLKIIRELGNKKQESTVLNNLAAIYKDRGNITEALRNHTESLEIKKQLNDSDGIATSFNNIGIIYANQGNITLALEYYFKALKISEAINSTDGIATTQLNIGMVYKDLGEISQAMLSFNRALELGLKANDKYNIGYALNAIGGLYEVSDSLDQAFIYYKRAFMTRVEIDDKQGMAHSLKNMGGIYEKRNSPKAIEHFTNSLKLFKEVDDKWGMTMANIKLGNSYFKAGEISKALIYANESLRLANELGYPSEIRDAALLMKKIYVAKKHWQLAYQMSDIYFAMRDSVQNSDNQKELFRQQFRHEYETKEAVLIAEQEKVNALANAELSRQKTEKYAWLSGFVLILISGILLYNRFHVTIVRYIFKLPYGRS